MSTFPYPGASPHRQLLCLRNFKVNFAFDIYSLHRKYGAPWMDTPYFLMKVNVSRIEAAASGSSGSKILLHAHSRIIQSVVLSTHKKTKYCSENLCFWYPGKNINISLWEKWKLVYTLTRPVKVLILRW